MVEWSPDKNKNCKKCVNHGTWIKKSFPHDINHKCECIDEGNFSQMNFTLVHIILDVLYNLNGDGTYENKVMCSLANICPLYKEKKEKSESFECTGGLCEYYHEVYGCDLNNNTDDCDLIREEKRIVKEV